MGFSPRSAVFAFLLLAPTLPGAEAQTAPHAVMLSDIHFDPFHEPAEAARLQDAPIEQWPAILSTPAAATQEADLAAMQEACHARALDTAWPLLQTALSAAKAEEPHPLFVTLSGDLLTHEFPCRFHHALPRASPEELASFAAKTLAFVTAQLRLAFPRSPVYAALGNNDSGCADYRETPGDAFLSTASQALLAAASPGGKASAASLQLSAEGDYTVLLPAPIQHTRLIVLNNVFESRLYNTCVAAADRTPEKGQLDWLRAQLAAARAHGEQAWVMAHIPPGIDVYTSFHRYILHPEEICTVPPEPFLADTAFADALLDYADLIRLAVFGHSHMDEFRLLHRTVTAQSTQPQRDSAPNTVHLTGAQRRGGTLVSQAAKAQSGHPGEALQEQEEANIPAKLVPSITPFLGNHPAFLVATIDPRTGILKDWRTIVSPGPLGSSPPWTEAYRYSTAYHLPDFSVASGTRLLASFTADRTGQAAASTTFRQHFYPGDFGLYALGLAQVWPAYACAVREDRPSAFHNCLCPTTPASTVQP